MNNDNHKIIILKNTKDGSILEEKVTVSEALDMFLKKEVKLKDLKIKEND